MQASRLDPRAAALWARMVESFRESSLRTPVKPKTRSASRPTTGAAHAAMEFSNDLHLMRGGRGGRGSNMWCGVSSVLCAAISIDRHREMCVCTWPHIGGTCRRGGTRSCRQAVPPTSTPSYKLTHTLEVNTHPGAISSMPWHAHNTTQHCQVCPTKARPLFTPTVYTPLCIVQAPQSPQHHPANLSTA